MYSKARSKEPSSFAGHLPSIGTTCCGEVPQVTMGGTSEPLIFTTTSNAAPSSLRRERQYSKALCHSSEFSGGTMGRPFKYSNVVSSGATKPARAPASMAMFDMDMRASIDKARTASPANSMALPVPPAVPIWPITKRTKSFEVTPGRNSPETSTNIEPGFCCRMVCVASTCSTSDVPMPNAKDPNAPCVAVCESPQTMVVPGSVKPCSGPTTWTMPCRASFMPK
mmetsp:Transcript_3030/g.9216  ORF Transcript_3030/g.9216 Transcript_3030/m.9216 type:complete len:225 (-) Transcript_3030:537-1211(-)